MPTTTNTPNDSGLKDEERRAASNPDPSQQFYDREFNDIAKHYDDETATPPGESDARPVLRSQAGLRGSGATDLAAQKESADRQATKSAKQGAQIPTNDLRAQGSNFGFSHEKPGAAAKIKGFAKKLGKNKKLLIGGGIGGGFLILGLIFVILTLGSLLIPNFAADMVAYQFARVTRETMASDAEMTGDKIAIDSSSDSAFTQAVKKYKNLKSGVWEKINQYRPEKVVENLKAEGQLYYESTTSKPILGFTRNKITKIHLNGNVIDVPQNSTSILDKLSHPLSYAKSLWQSNKAIKGTLKDTLNTTARGTNYIIRGKVAGIIDDDIGIVRTRWSKNDLKKFNGENTTDADVQNAQESYKTATNNGQAATVAEEKSGAEESTAKAAQDATDKCVQNPKCVKETIDSNSSLPSQAVDVLNKAYNPNALDSALKFLAPTYAVAVPLCLIYQGSMVNSGGVIKANSQEDERTGYSIATAADQQKYGDVNGEAIGALSRQMGSNGEVARSNVEQRAGGAPINTTQSGVEPQASAAGGYSYNVFDFLPSGLDSFFTHAATPMCAIFDNPWTGVIIGIGSLLIPGLGESLSGAEDVTLSTVAKIVLVNTAWNIKYTTRELGGIAKNFLLTGGTVVAGTILAKIVTISHMGAANNGLSRNQSYDNQADAGMNLYAQDADRQQNYAAPMTSSGTAQAKAMDTAYLTHQEQSQSAFERYLAVDNPTSLVDKLGTMTLAHLNTSSLSSIVTSAARIFNPVTAFSSVFSLFQSKSMAAAATTSDTSDYGIVQWGWTPIEEWHYENDPNYSMFTNQQALDKSGQESAIASKYGKCFTEDISNLLSTPQSKPDLERDKNGNILTSVSDGDCAPDNLSPTNRDDPNTSDPLIFANSTAQLVFRWRVAMRNNNNLSQLIDTQNATSQ